MMLYNEWVHQMVLLRDALLPFSNWADVPLPLDGMGLRHLEAPRERFLSELMIRQIRHTAIVDYTRAVLVPGQGSHVEGYGFAYAEGTVLPQVTSAASILTSTDLLVWSPIRAIGAARDGVVETYVPREANYFEASRTAAELIASTAGKSTLADATARIVDSHATDGRRHAMIEVTIPETDTVAMVDLGQALRGHRYAYPTAAAEETAPRGAAAWIAAATSLDAGSVITAEDMVWDDDGDYHIDAGQDGLVALALLGATYPENVVIRRTSDDVNPSAVGKTGPARFVVTLPD
jgi:hypothetical protein